MRSTYIASALVAYAAAASTTATHGVSQYNGKNFAGLFNSTNKPTNPSGEVHNHYTGEAIMHVDQAEFCTDQVALLDAELVTVDTKCGLQ